DRDIGAHQGVLAGADLRVPAELPDLELHRRAPRAARSQEDAHAVDAGTTDALSQRARDIPVAGRAPMARVAPAVSAQLVRWALTFRGGGYPRYEPRRA